MSQFERLSSDFRESLFQAFAQCPSKAEVLEQVPAQDDNQKAQIENIVGLCKSFCDRIVKDWVIGLDDEERTKAEEVFKKLENVSTGAFILAMSESGAKCPFCTLGDLISMTLKGDEMAPNGEVVIVQEELGPSMPDKLEGGLPI